MSDSRKTSGTSRSRSGAALTDADRTALEQRHAARKAAKEARKKPCIHRGKKTSAADVYSPRGVGCCKLYECAIYKLCSVSRVVPDVATCADCHDYAANRRQPDPDSGVAG